MNAIRLKVDYGDPKERVKVAQRFIERTLWQSGFARAGEFVEFFDIVMEGEKIENGLPAYSVPALLIQGFVSFALLGAGIDRGRVAQFVERFCLKGFQMEDAFAQKD